MQQRSRTRRIAAPVMLLPFFMVAVLAYIPTRTSRGVTLHWKAQQMPLIYALNDQTSAALPNITDDSAPVAAVERAILTWRAVAGAGISFAPLVLTPETGPGGASSRVSRLISFADSPENRELLGDDLTIATTLIEWNDNDGSLQRTVTLFNPKKTFSTTQNEDAYDIQAVAAHELGHSLGANHSAVLNASMFPYSDKGQVSQRTLAEDDEAFLIETYPGAPLGKEFGEIRGRVLLEDRPLFGAHVVAQDEENSVLVGCLSKPDGSFEMKGIRPGRYILYIEPLDLPVSALNLAGPQLSYYGVVNASFGTSLVTPVTRPGLIEVVAGRVTQLETVKIQPGPPALNISRAGRAVGRTPEGGFISPACFTARPGESFMVFLEGAGVYERIASTEQIKILGNGVQILAPQKVTRVIYRDETKGISFLVEVSRDARPGPRTILISDGGSLAAFTGGLEIQSLPENSYVLRFPFLAVDGNVYTGVALANVSTQSAILQCTAYSDAGLRLAGAGIVNPVVLLLEPGKQAALMAEELFHFPPGAGFTGWMEISSNNNQVTGSYIVGDRAGEFIDGTDVGQKTAKEMYLPGITQMPGASTEVSFVNPDPLGWASVALQLYDRSGRSLSSIARQLPPRARLTGTIDALLRVNNLDLGYLEVTSDMGLVGAYLLGDTPSNGGAHKKLAALRAQTVDRQALRYHAPHFLAGGGFTAAVFFANPNTTPLNAKIQIKGDNGAPLVPVIERSIPPHATILLRSEDLGLRESSASMVEGSLWIDTQGGPVTGGVLFQDLAGGSLAGTAIQAAGYQEAFLSQVAVGVMGFFTGIASVNVGDIGAQAEAVMFDASGREVARGTRYLPPGGRFSEILEQLTGFRGQQQGGYVRISSTSPLASLGLIGTSRTLALVAAQVRGQ